MSFWLLIPLGVGIAAAVVAVARRNSAHGIYVGGLVVFLAAVLTAIAPASATAAVNPSATIVGTVTLTAADGGAWAGDGARVTLACGTGTTTRIEVADDRGVFRFL